MSQKSLFQRFQDWQKNPFPPDKMPYNTPFTCLNCGHTYEGNYCPVCGQAHNVGKVSWASVALTIKSLLGLKGDPGSLVNFVIQLFGRPGYMISDYLSGRRKSCDSPIQNLLIMVACAILVQNVSGHTGVYHDLVTADAGFMGRAFGWLSDNLSWAILIQTALLIFPTLLFFRDAPKHTHHSLPEGIYIQIFMCSLVLMIMMLRCGVGDWILLLVPVYYYIAYRELFGFGIWGTAWRTVLSLGSIFGLMAILMALTVK